jgi:hypothetical protein
MANKSSIEILKELPALFRKVDVEKWTRHPSIFLNRAVQKKWIDRVARGSYVNTYLKGLPIIEEIGCFLRPPAYVSGEWALHHYGVLLQVPRVCLLVTLRSSVGQSRSLDYRDTTLEFSKIAPSLFWGFERKEGYDLATPEKALLDLIYLRGKIPLMDELERSELNFEKLYNFSERFPRTVRDKISELIKIKT